MLKSFMTAGLLVLSFCASAASFTQAEKTELAKVAKYIETTCHKELKADLDKRSPSPNMPELQKVLSNLAAPEEYCPCLSKTFQQDITPEIVRKNNPEAVQLVIKNAAKSCAIAQFKRAMPNLCQSVFNEIRKHTTQEVFNEEKIGKICACVQAEAGQLTVANFDSYVQNTLSDYREYQKTRQLAENPNSSLLAGIQRCQMSEMQGLLQEKAEKK